ncbi:MAG: hypothetical protein CSA65_04945 [Proteobacteria bacterium]|nr:MAG: hypothetical protein CSA65_04945 [Pseudomonadota bacterium]
MLVLAVGLATPAKGQRATPLLHEYVRPPSRGQPLAPTGEKLPEAIRGDDRLLPRPQLSKGRARDEQLLGERQAMDRSTSLAPDRKTIHDGQLRYAASFNPSVVPFKRLTAYDAVGADFKLRVSDRRLHPLSLARRPTPPTREAFWGSLLLDLQAAKPAPIPSVAPNAVIVSYESQPQRTASFLRDAAGNYWIQAKHTGRVRLIFLTDAPRLYFSPEIPPEVTASDVPSKLRPKLPARVRQAAMKVVTHIGVRSRRIYRQVERLVAYFRNFRPGKLPARHDNTYLDIAFSQRGVCRHRSYAFVITAHALGIPARYVANEAHAFVEVYAPRHGWLRIDLGGASNGLHVGNAKRKAVHRPGPDPFPRPSAYTTNYSQLAGNVSGLSRRQLPKPWARRRRSLSSYSRQREDASGAAEAANVRAPARTLSDIHGADPGPGSGSAAAAAAPQLPLAPQRKRKATKTTLYSSASSVLRGKTLHVWGDVQAGAQGAAGLRVEIVLSKDGKTAYFLGATQTNALGAFKARLPIPTHLAVGRYRVYAATVGDTDHSPSLSK